MNDHDRIIRIDENVENIRERLTKGDELMKHHEQRISKLERWKAGIISGLALISIFATYILTEIMRRK